MMRYDVIEVGYGRITVDEDERVGAHIDAANGTVDEAHEFGDA